MLLKSLSHQTATYELILLDNTCSVFESAAKALNDGGSRATGKYIMFVHQDVSFETATWLEEAERILDSLPSLGVAGVAGVAGMSESSKNIKERVRNIIYYGKDRRTWGRPIDAPEIVQTLDCCLFMVPKIVFDVLKFDENTCDDWHLYGEDYCLSCGSKGLSTYVIPLSVYHVSLGISSTNRIKILLKLGALPKPYYTTLKKLIDKHRYNYKYIYTTCGEWNTYQPVLLQRIIMLARASLELAVDKCNQFASRLRIS